MRIEGDRRRHSSDGLRAFDHMAHDPLMPKMQPVKNSQRQNRRPQNIGVFQPVKYLHNLYGNSILGDSFRQIPEKMRVRDGNGGFRDLIHLDRPFAERGRYHSIILEQEDHFRIPLTRLRQ